MKKQITLILLSSIIFFSAKPLMAIEKSTLPGTWKCVANDVPDMYRSSSIIITEKGGKLEGKVKFEGGIEINLNYVKQTGKDVVMSLYVEGYEILINSKQEGNKLTGTADTPEGKVSLTATKEEVKK